jgi:hypothetical protein
METTEKIVEAYVRYVRGWATIPNLRCDGQHEIDLLAIDPVTLERYHIETSVSGSHVYSRLTAKEFKAELLKERVQKAKMRRTVGYFMEHKFGNAGVIAKLAEFKFEPGTHTRVIVTWGWTKEAKETAGAAGIELWDFRKMLREIAQPLHKKRTYFTDDTLRTLNLFVRALDDVDPETPVDAINLETQLKPGSSKTTVQSETVSASSFEKPFWVYRNWIHQRARMHHAACVYCNNGVGTQGATNSATGEWKPFLNEAEARAYLKGTGYQDASTCGTCFERLAGKIPDFGEINRHGQQLVGKSELRGNHPFAKLWMLRCSLPDCGEEYQANSCDFHERRCPKHGGQPASI